MHLEYSYFILCVVNAIGMMNATDDVKYLQSLCENSLWTDLKELLLSINENGKPVALNEIVNAASVTSETLSHKATQMHLLLSCNISITFVKYSEIAKCIKDNCIHKKCENHLKMEFQRFAELIELWKLALSKLSSFTESNLKTDVTNILNILIELGSDDKNIDNNLEKLPLTLQNFMVQNCYKSSLESILDISIPGIQNYLQSKTSTCFIKKYLERIRYVLAAIYDKLDFDWTDALDNTYSYDFIKDNYQSMCVIQPN